MDIRLLWFVLSDGYWSQAGISHFDDQKAAFKGARVVKCRKSAANTVVVEVCPSTAPIL